MSLLQQVRSRLPPLNDESANTNFDLVSEFGTGPFSPPCTTQIRMDGEFRPHQMVEGLLSNLLYRQVQMNLRAWHRIIDLCSVDFSDVSHRIAIQLMFQFSKLDPNDLHPFATFDDFLSRNALLLNEFIADAMDPEQAESAKQFLCLPLVVRCFQDCLKEVLGNDYDQSTICNLISSANIYSCPVGMEFRGCCMFDGFAVNSDRMYKFSFQAKKEADAMTLMFHECIHYLARKFANNYNFSTPFTNCSAEGGRRDTVFPTEKRLELGRLAELSLFGLQPSWKHSEKDAAVTFLEKVRSTNTKQKLPLQIDGLSSRIQPSVASCLDLEIDEPVMC